MNILLCERNTTTAEMMKLSPIETCMVEDSETTFYIAPKIADPHVLFPAQVESVAQSSSSGTNSTNARPDFDEVLLRPKPPMVSTASPKNDQCRLFHQLGKLGLESALQD